MGTAKVWKDGTAVSVSFDGPQRLETVLAELDLAPEHPCGGRGICGKCAVTLDGAVSPPNGAERDAGTRLSCQAVLLGDCQIWLPSTQDDQIDLSGTVTVVPDGRETSGIGAAVDVGTTTVALKLYDLRSGRELSAAGTDNPQRAVAADVIGRIGAALAGDGERLQTQITGAIDRLLRLACGRAGVPRDAVQDMVVTGNTSMLYLLTGRDPSPLSHAPFQADCLFDQTELLLGIPAYHPPCMDAFVGADITCAVLASGMLLDDGPALLCDIGTNGELALWSEGKLYVTATAAGPAFEGAGISCGCSSIPGAIDRVWAEDGKIHIHTIDQAPAAGICGSGLIGAIAAFLHIGAIDETGAARQEGLPLADGLRLLPADVRAVQMSKAAIAAGIETLLLRAKVPPEAVRTLYIAGGFGSHLRIEDAYAIGLLPRSLGGRVSVIGNGALSGAAGMLLDKEQRRLGRALVQKAVPMNLGGDPAFNDRYIEHLFF